MDCSKHELSAIFSVKQRLYCKFYEIQHKKSQEYYASIANNVPVSLSQSVENWEESRNEIGSEKFQVWLAFSGFLQHK